MLRESPCVRRFCTVLILAAESRFVNWTPNSVGPRSSTARARCYLLKQLDRSCGGFNRRNPTSGPRLSTCLCRLRGSYSNLRASTCWTIILPVSAIRCTTPRPVRSEEHTSELQSRGHLVCRLLLEKKKDSCSCTTYDIS